MRLVYIMNLGPRVSSSFFLFLFFFKKMMSRKYQKVSTRGVHVRSVRFFSKFITEPIEIGFLIIRTDAHHLRSVFQPIAVPFFAVGLIGLKLFKTLRKYKMFKLNINTPTCSKLQANTNFYLFIKLSK